MENEQIITNFVKNTKFLCKRDGKNVTEVEDLLGISRGYLSKFLKKGIMPALTMVMRVAKLFDVSVEVLCDVDLSESGDDRICTFVQTHGKHVERLSYDDNPEDEITAFAEKLMIPKRDLISSVYSCIPAELRGGESIEKCVYAYWGVYKRLLNLSI